MNEIRLNLRNANNSRNMRLFKHQQIFCFCL